MLHFKFPGKGAMKLRLLGSGPPCGKGWAKSTALTYEPGWVAAQTLTGPFRLNVLETSLFTCVGI